MEIPFLIQHGKKLNLVLKNLAVVIRKVFLS